MFKGSVTTAPFKEHLIIDLSLCEAGEFDICSTDKDHPCNFILNEKFNLEQYCFCLLKKLFSLNKSKIKPFIQYQCERLNDPFVWINKFEKLIDLNRELFTTKEQNIKVDKALMVIELLRQEIELNKFNKDGLFNFEKVKKQLKEYPTYEDKMSFLLEKETEYKQNKPKVLNPDVVSFDLQVQYEKEKLEQQEILSERAKQRVKLISKPKAKLQIKTNLNYFVDFFYQLMYERGVIEGSSKELAELIATGFLDKDGHPVSPDTVQTLLKPSNNSKRPKGDLRMNLD